MSSWIGTVLGPPHSVHENRIYSIRIHCGEEYPERAPSVYFVSKINLPCVDGETGRVEPRQLRCLAEWRSEHTLETVLMELRREMAQPDNKRLPQPPEGAQF